MAYRLDSGMRLHLESPRKLPVLPAGKCLVAPDTSKAISTREEQVNNWAVEVRNKLQDIIDSNNKAKYSTEIQQPGEEDVQELVDCLIALFIDAMKKNT